MNACSTDEKKKRVVSKQEFEALRFYLKEKGEIHLEVVSASMEPLIKVGEQVDVKPMLSGSGTLKKFDIIVFWNGELLICHYIRNFNLLAVPGGQGSITTRGLKTRRYDLPCYDEMILGRVLSHRLTFWQKLRLRLLDVLNFR